MNLASMSNLVPRLKYPPYKSQADDEKAKQTEGYRSEQEKGNHPQGVGDLVGHENTRGTQNE